MEGPSELSLLNGGEGRAISAQCHVHLFASSFVAWLAFSVDGFYGLFGTVEISKYHGEFQFSL